MTAVTSLTVRQAYRGAAVVAVVSAGMSAFVAGTYRSTVGDGPDVASLRALATNPAIRTLFGEPTGLDTVGGFTVWRTGTVLAVTVGVWGLLAATRLTRGEEEARRWDLLLTGRLPATAVTVRTLLVLFAAALVTGAGVTAALLAVGTAVPGAVLHGAGIAVTGVFFTAAGGLAAQLWPARTSATMGAMALLVGGLLVRMVGDGVPWLSWLRWLSPFGLLELSRPYAGDRPLPLLVLAGAAAAVTAATVAAGRRRDLHSGWFRPDTGRPPRLALLASVPGFAVRRALRTLAGWTLAIASYYLLVGLVGRSMTRFLTDNPRFADAAGQAGFTGLGSVEGYAGTLFALLAVPVGVFAAGHIAVLAEDESAGRLTLVYAQPVSRTALLGAETATAAGAAALLAVAAALAVWLGATVGDLGLTLTDALAGAVNVLPVALLCLGAAVLALGLAPRYVALVGSLPAAGGFLWYVLADTVGAPAWSRRLSPFAHLAPVPATGPDPAGTVGMLAVAAAAAVVGWWAYRRRDLRTG
jgi:ABC-2 type transport system permease protein